MAVYIETTDACKILGLSRTTVLKMIKDKTITSAIQSLSCGFSGRPGFIMKSEEIESLRDRLIAEKNRKKLDRQAKRSMSDNDKILKSLSDISDILTRIDTNLKRLCEEL